MSDGTVERAIRVEHPRCPYCHEDLRAEGEKTGCKKCMAWHHGTLLYSLGKRSR